MTILQCKYCGAPLKNVKKGSSTAQCEYCRNIVAVPALDDDLKLQMLNKATELRVRREYDRAAQVYQSVEFNFLKKRRRILDCVFANTGWNT